jgi:hypothetical protein
LSVHEQPQGSIATALRCKRWTCGDCGPKRRKRLIAEAMSGAPTSFLTLTYNARREGTPEEHAADLSHAWRLLRKRMLRKWSGHRFPFIAVFERTQRGEPHLHILLRGPYIPQQWLSEQMDDLIESPICDIRFIRSRQQVAGYVAKYVGKDPEHFGTSKRYWSSRDYAGVAFEWTKPEKWEPGFWSIVRGTLDSIGRYWERNGYSVTVIEPERAIWAVLGAG